jgi:6-phosphogluconolactonase
MQLKVLKDADAVAAAGAAGIAAAARLAISDKGSFTLAVSGGHTPWVMLRMLAGEDLPWSKVHLFQADERVAPADDPDRNLTHLRDSFLAHVPLPPENLHVMPVEDSDLAEGAAAYGRVLEQFAGAPPRLDLVHLGLGPDGHTASLVPGDPVLEVGDASVGVTGPYQDRRRMTLTYPALDAAQAILFIVTGADKADALAKLRRQDPTVPAGRLRAANIVVLADQAAAEGLTDG